MKIEFTRDAEKDRVKFHQEQRQSPAWEHFKSTSIVEAAHRARDMGWKENKVQLRYVESEDMFYVEPYERGCGCRGILKYSDYFD